ncbi:hypothetical protein TCELL_1191 [Thermogladius calderae 1633]|uniref:Uncharacterized protein n=1 Tax=Thermogladius calderae (strain DSM 22663 / VKM B-2946 / 1633) TaxID=1184251 RepID=I3TFS6_THEC1|nr:hypothetical protein TCELL_1191 [Thermogladius calderae 1633]
MVIVEPSLRSALALAIELLVRGRPAKVVVAPAGGGLSRESPLIRGLLVALLKLTTPFTRVEVYSWRDYAVLSAALGNVVRLNPSAAVFKVWRRHQPYPVTPVVVVAGGEPRDLDRIADYLSENRLGLVIVVSPAPPRAAKASPLVVYVVSDCYGDVAWSASICLTPSTSIHSILAASECLRSGRAVVAPEGLPLLVGKRLREAVVWARDLSLEELLSALLTAINRLGDLKKLFLRERETA